MGLKNKDCINVPFCKSGKKVTREGKECEVCLYRKMIQRSNKKQIEKSRLKIKKTIFGSKKNKPNQKINQIKKSSISNKKSKKSKLIDLLDTLVREIVKKRDCENGYFVCISCKKTKNEIDGENGHYIPRSNLSVRWDLVNNNYQCIECNRFKDGFSIGYKKGIIKKYGEEKLIELDFKSKLINKLTIAELEDLAQNLKQI